MSPLLVWAHLLIKVHVSHPDKDPVLVEEEATTENDNLDYEELKCPKYNSYLERGELYLRATFLGFVFFGWSYKHCYYIAKGKNRRRMDEIKVIDNSETKEALHCKKCGLIITEYTPYPWQ